MPKIEVIELNKYFVERKKKQAVAALYNVNCVIPNGSFSVVCGCSGCGKTTLLRNLTGLISPDSGKILFDGVDITDVSTQKRNVAYLSQEYALYPHLTVFDNIAYPLKIMGASADEIRRRVGAICKISEIEFLISRRIGQLSGGQLQRVALARALVKNPDVIFLDEPLSNLDVKTRRVLSDHLAEMHRKTGVTFVYVTHDISEACRLATYILVMDDGTIVQQGEAAKVIEEKDGAFYRFERAADSMTILRKIDNNGDGDDEVI